MPRDDQTARSIRLRAAAPDPGDFEPRVDPRAPAADPDAGFRRRAREAQARWEEDEFTTGEGPDGEPEYRRPARRVRVQRGRINPAIWRYAKAVAQTTIFAIPALVALAAAWRFVTGSPQFALADSDQVQLSGGQHVMRSQVIGRFASDLGRNIFFIPLDARLHSIEQIAWVHSAAVLRVWPDQLQVRIVERRPVAFARIAGNLWLVDADGVLLEQSGGDAYDFPVLTGMRGSEGALADRRQRVRRFLAMQAELDSDGERHSADLSEVHLSDPDDVQVTVAVGERSVEPIVIHLGDHDFLARYKLYLAHIQEWRHTFPRLSSIDLRYNGQAIINQR